MRRHIVTHSNCFVPHPHPNPFSTFHFQDGFRNQLASKSFCKLIHILLWLLVVWRYCWSCIFAGTVLFFFFHISQHREVLFYSFSEALQHARFVTFCLFCRQKLIFLLWEARVFDGSMLKSSPASIQA